MKSHGSLFVLALALSGSACAHAQLSSDWGIPPEGVSPYESVCTTVPAYQQPGAIADAEAAGWSLRTAGPSWNYYWTGSVELCFRRPRRALEWLATASAGPTSAPALAPAPAPAEAKPHRPVFIPGE
jgi:hypothetical protein